MYRNDEFMVNMRKNLFLAIVVLMFFCTVSCEHDVETRKMYTVAFDANGAEGLVPRPISFEEGGSVVIPTNGSLHWEGHVFVCWNTSADGSGTTYKPNYSYNEDADLMLYAIWSVDPLEYIYLTDSDSYAVICKDKNVRLVVIPSTYNGKNVSQIAPCAFWKCNYLTDITIPKSVTEIGWGAFADCTSLKEVTIPSRVESIELSAFQNCSSLTKVTIQKGVSTIGPNAFSNCTGLTEITIPEGVTKLGGSAFSGCSGLTRITIPKSVTSIGSSAFANCSSLLEVKIPNGVTAIYDNTFKNCRKLTYITIPECVTEIGDYAFSGCEGITEITIPKGVINIGNYVFDECSVLSVIFADGMKKIPYEALIYSHNVVSMSIPASVTNIGRKAFAGCSQLTDIYYNGVLSQWSAIEKADGWDSNTPSYTLHFSDGSIVSKK